MDFHTNKSYSTTTTKKEEKTKSSARKQNDSISQIEMTIETHCRTSYSYHKYLVQIII